MLRESGVADVTDETIVLLCSDVKPICSAVSKLGGRVLVKPILMPNGVHTASICDPNGIRIRLLESDKVTSRLVSSIA